MLLPIYFFKLYKCSNSKPGIFQTLHMMNNLNPSQRTNNTRLDLIQFDLSCLSSLQLKTCARPPNVMYVILFLRNNLRLFIQPFTHKHTHTHIHTHTHTHTHIHTHTYTHTHTKMYIKDCYLRIIFLHRI